jgi:hypothetical protein
MKGLLGTSADFIDRLANPGHGVDVNEAYGLRLAELFTRDPEFLDRLDEDELYATDVDLVSTSSWLWLLALRRAGDRRLSDDLLHALWDSTPEPVVRLQVLETVTNYGPTVEGFAARGSERWASIHDVPDRWLAARVLRAVEPGREEDTRAEVSEVPLAPARELVIMLLQVGNPVSLDTARVLLAHEWDGRARLIEMTRSLLGGLDPGTRDDWFGRLGLAERPLE